MPVTNTAQQDLRTLIGTYRPNYSLPAAFYASDAVYRADLERIFFRGWMYAGHVSQVGEPGAYFLVDVGEESIIVVRDEAGEVHAFANVCRHRGSRICTERAGRVKSFVCPYHAWAYQLNGALRSRRAMPADFDQSQYGLKPVRSAVFHGLVFINLDPQAPDLDAGLQPVSHCFDVYDLANTRVAAQEIYTVDANWKLTIENFMECYHCAPAHTEYSRFHALKTPRDNAALRPAMLQKAQGMGYCIDTVDNSTGSADAPIQYYHARNALYEPHVTGSRDGQPAAPLLGQVQGYDGGVADLQLGPAFFGLLYGDHAVLYRFMPRDVQKTDMDVVWLVRADAVEGVDYDLADITWLWQVTTEADKKIILHNQQGVNSAFYEPGPLSEMEDFTVSFIEWYLAQLEPQ